MIAVLALAGCGGEEQDQVEGTGYGYAVPDGWEEEDGDDIEVGPFRPDSLVVGDREGGFATNVNVIREPGVPADVTAAQYAEVSLAGLRDPAGAGYPPELVETIESLGPSGITEPREPSSRRGGGDLGLRTPPHAGAAGDGRDGRRRLRHALQS